MWKPTSSNPTCSHIGYSLLPTIASPHRPVQLNPDKATSQPQLSSYRRTHHQCPPNMRLCTTQQQQHPSQLPTPPPSHLTHSITTQIILLQTMTTISFKLLCKPAAMLHYCTTTPPPFTINDPTLEAFSSPLMTKNSHAP